MEFAQPELGNASGREREKVRQRLSPREAFEALLPCDTEDLFLSRSCIFRAFFLSTCWRAQAAVFNLITHTSHRPSRAHVERWQPQQSTRRGSTSDISLRQDNNNSRRSRFSTASSSKQASPRTYNRLRFHFTLNAFLSYPQNEEGLWGWSLACLSAQRTRTRGISHNVGSFETTVSWEVPLPADSPQMIFTAHHPGTWTFGTIVPRGAAAVPHHRSLSTHYDLYAPRFTPRRYEATPHSACNTASPQRGGHVIQFHHACVRLNVVAQQQQSMHCSTVTLSHDTAHL